MGKNTALLLLLILIAIISYSLASRSNSEQSITEKVKEDAPKTETTNWTIEKFETLGLEFKVPTYLSMMDYPKGFETKGETGTQFCVQYLKSDITSFLIKKANAGGGACFPESFGIGTTSIDYQAGRMGGFGDVQGYMFEDGKYYAKTVSGKTFEIPNELVSEITNPNGIKILQVTGADSIPSSEDVPAFPILGTPGSGRIGAIINIQGNAKYTGITFEMKIDDKLTPEVFKEILDTVKLTK